MIQKWFSLRIRDLFFLVAIAAILVSWHLDRKRIIEEFNPSLPAVANWQVEQIVGVPDTKPMGDIPTAWASATQDGSKEWVEVTYSWLHKPKAIEIYESYNPGAVTKVTMFDWLGKEHVVWSGADNLAARRNMGVHEIPIENSFLTRRVKIYIDSPAVPGWNEIDAIGLVDRNGKQHWATGATASSCYGNDNQIPFVRGSMVVATEEPFAK